MAARTPAVPSSGDAEATWRYIETGLDKIMVDPQNGIGMETYMGVYTAIHDFCTVQRRTAATFRSAGERGKAHLLGEELYERLIDYLVRHLKGIVEESRKHHGEALLSFYLSQWNHYLLVAESNSRLFRFLERHWVLRELDEGKKNLYKIYTLHLVQWKAEVFAGTQEPLIQYVLGTVEKERISGTTHPPQVKTFLDSLASLHIDKKHEDVYQRYFEKPFLEDTVGYYNRNSTQFLAHNVASEYIKWALSRSNEEVERVKSYLHSDTMQPLMEVCNEVLIVQHSDVFDKISVDDEDAEGRTPLSFAAQLGNEVIVRLLLANQHVRTDFKDNEGRTPLAWALKGGHDGIADLLIQHMEKHDPNINI